jgi:hypothetical protein
MMPEWLPTTHVSPSLTSPRGSHDSEGMTFKGDNLVFLVGCSRSGTTWLQRLIAAHPRVHTGPESYVFFYIENQLSFWRNQLNPKGGASAIGMSAYLTEDEFLGALREHLMALLQGLTRNLRPGEVFLDKTPDHSLFITDIHSFLPRARFIHIIRDPRDVVASLLRLRSIGREWPPSNAKDATRYWVQRVVAAREALAQIPAPQVCELTYENLLASPQNELRRLLDFIGLAYDEGLISNAVEQNSVAAARDSGGRAIPVGGEMAKVIGTEQKLPRGFLGKATSGNWKEDLSWNQKFWVWREAGVLMEQMGYNWEVPYWYGAAGKLLNPVARARRVI